jgi:TRAP-type C4-dicarboxylate transport system permease small subunit
MKITNIIADIVINRSDIDIPQPSPEQNPFTIGLNIFFGLAAAVAVLVIAVSAFKIVNSRGNTQEVTKARDSIIYAVVGLGIALSAFAIVNFVIDRI